MNPVDRKVSYLYWPTQRGVYVGHAEVAFLGRSYSLKNCVLEDRELEEVFGAGEHGGRPFFEFSVEASEDQIAKLKELVSKESGPICSLAALNLLKKVKCLEVPKLFRIFPSHSAAYLFAKKFFSRTSRFAINCHGNFSLRNMISKVLPGPLTEFVTLNAIAMVASSILGGPDLPILGIIMIDFKFVP